MAQSGEAKKLGGVEAKGKRGAGESGKGGRFFFRFPLSLRPFKNIMGTNISKYKCPIFGYMKGPTVMDSKAGLPDIGISYSFHLS
jgi:hypothetical protein